MTETTRRPKHVSFDLGEPVSREEMEREGLVQPGEEMPDIQPVWEFETISKAEHTRLLKENAALKEQFRKCREFLKENLILNPTDNWQWGYRAAVLGMADSLLFAEKEGEKC